MCPEIAASQIFYAPSPFCCGRVRFCAKKVLQYRNLFDIVVSGLFDQVEYSQEKEYRDMTCYTYKTKGTCSQRVEVILDGTIIKEAKIIGGCYGNLQGIANLVQGMEAEEVIRRVKGIRCGFKTTSCPDQLACALESMIAE